MPISITQLTGFNGGPVDAFRVRVSPGAAPHLVAINAVGADRLHVEWGDGSVSIASGNGGIPKFYPSNADFDVAIYGRVTSFEFFTYTPEKVKQILSPILGITGLSSVYALFGFCVNLVGGIPDNMFTSCPEIVNFEGAFANCTQLSGAIPSHLFAASSASTNLRSMFMRTALSGSIPGGVFDPRPDVSSFENCFFHDSGQSQLTGNAPALWLRDPEPIGAACFGNCTGLSNYADIPAGWK